MNIAVVEALSRKALGVTSKVQFCWHGGETLLMGKNFYEKAIEFQNKYSRGSKVLNTIQTNGLLLDEMWYSWLTQNDFRIGVSCDGSTCHDLNRKTYSNTGSYQKVRETLEMINKKEKKYGGVLAVVTPQMLMHQEDILSEFTSLGIQKVDFLRYKADNGGLSVEDYYGFMRQVFKQWLKLDNPSIKIRTIDATLNYFIKGKSRLCRFLGDCKRFLTVRPNGDIYPCECLNGSSKYIRLGNILTDEISEIYVRAGEVIKQNPHSENCLSCQFNSLCQNACAELERQEGNCSEKRMFFQDLSDLVQAVKEKNAIT